MPCYLRNMRVFFRVKRYKRMRLLMGLVSFWCAALAVGAGTAEPGRDVTVGLFWNKTGLPAVFPLLIDSAEGQDYEVLLSDAHSGADAMAAGLQGGSPLRLLVPPGEYQVSFWMPGNLRKARARSGTPELALDVLLRFALSGANVKSGHRIDISPARDGDGWIITRALSHRDRRLDVPRVKSAVPDVTKQVTDPVGQQILKRRFERGMPVDQLYDLQRQQQDYDPPVLGLPQVPLARPKSTKIPWISPPQ